jgi:hypothetical protein
MLVSSPILNVSPFSGLHWGHTQHGSTTAQPWTAPLITRAHCDQAAHGDYLAPEASVCNYGAKDSTPVERIATTRHW